jgi:hypothetical protein
MQYVERQPTFRTDTLFLAWLNSSNLKMEAICSFETSVDLHRSTRRYIPEGRTLHNHRCENLASYTLYIKPVKNVSHF